MAYPQIENGYTEIANELLDAIVRHGFTKRQYKVLLAVIRQTYGWHKTEDDITSSQLSDKTGLVDTHCRAAVRELVELRVLNVEPGQHGQVMSLEKDYERWRTKTVRAADQNSPGRGPKQSGQEDQNSPARGPKQSGQRTKTVLVEDQNSPASGPKQSGQEDRNSPARGPKQSGQRTKTVREGGPKQSGKEDQNSPHKINSQNKLPKTTPKTPPPQTVDNSAREASTSVRGGGGEGLIFPQSMGESERQQAVQIVAACNGHQQDLLDELAGIMDAGRIKVSPMSCLRGLMKREQEGTFTLDAGCEVKKARDVRARSSLTNITETPSTDEVLRQHARLQGIPEEEYLARMSMNTSQSNQSAYTGSPAEPKKK